MWGVPGHLLGKDHGESYLQATQSEIRSSFKHKGISACKIWKDLKAPFESSLHQMCSVN